MEKCVSVREKHEGEEVLKESSVVMILFIIVKRQQAVTSRVKPGHPDSGGSRLAPSLKSL